jgi:hypothetical protein
MRMNNGIPGQRLSEVASSVLIFLSPMRVAPVLIGGCALAARGLPYETSDVDLLVDCNQSKLREIANRIKGAGYPLDALSEQALRDGESAELRFYREGIQIDLIPTSNDRERHVHSQATMESWFGTSIRMACLVDAIVEKLRTGRTTGLEQLGPIIMAKFSDCERRKALRDCRGLGLMAAYGTLIPEVFGD